MIGAIISISFSLFAYVYILARASFLYQSQNFIDLGKNLGFSRFKTLLFDYFTCSSTSNSCWFIISCYGNFAEFGAVDFFSINTLTTGIYNSWITFDDLAFANQLSFYLLLFIFALFILENLSRNKAKYHFNTKGGFKQKGKITTFWQ